MKHFSHLTVLISSTSKSNLHTYSPVPGKFLGIVGQEPSDSKSSWLHVDIFRFCFHSFEVYFFIDSSKMIGNFPEVSNFNRLFLKLNQFICT